MTREQINPHGYDADENVMMEMEVTAFKVSLVEKAYGSEFKATSGLRSMEHHLKIYADKNAALKAAGKPEVKVPMGSKHLKGQAVDVADRYGNLMTWCRKNEEKLREIGVWIEHGDYTKGWVHFQTVPYGSYKPGKSIFFIPY
jgi:hypothetical protein